MSTMFGFKKYISAIAILTDFKKTVDIILCQQSENAFLGVYCLNRTNFISLFNNRIL